MDKVKQINEHLQNQVWAFLSHKGMIRWYIVPNGNAEHLENDFHEDVSYLPAGTVSSEVNTVYCIYTASHKLAHSKTVIKWHHKKCTSLCWILNCRMKPESFQHPLGPGEYLNIWNVTLKFNLSSIFCKCISLIQHDRINYVIRHFSFHTFSIILSQAIGKKVLICRR